MTLVQTILERAAAYLDRPAIIAADGTVTLYSQLSLKPATEYHTTGTTGKPNKIVITDENMQRRLARLAQVRPWLADVTKLFLPMPIGTPIGRQLLTHMLLKGGTVYQVAVTDDLAAALNRCEIDQVDGIALVPKINWHWLLLEQAGDYRFPYVFVSGAAITAEQVALVYARLGQNIYMNYAASEVGQIAGGAYEDIKHIPGCVGSVASGVEVTTDEGRVAIRCDTIVGGYTHAAELTNQRFRDGWFYPGDIGHFEGDLLVIDGRA